jgi:hypothetical protein
MKDKIMTPNTENMMQFNAISGKPQNVNVLKKHIPLTDVTKYAENYLKN